MADFIEPGPSGYMRVLSWDNIMKCPYFILMPEHYRSDGSCRCNDPDHPEMAKWGYEWKNGSWRAPEGNFDD